MLIFFPLAILFAAVLLITFLPKIRPSFSSEWLFSVGAMILSAVSFALLRSRLPLVQSISAWENIPPLENSPTLIVDQTSWSFALTVLVLGVSCFLTPVMQSPSVRNEIILALWLIFITLFSILSGNPLTIALFWMLFDLLAFIFHILLAPEDQTKYHAKVLATNLASTFLLVIGVVISGENNPGDIEMFSFAFPSILIAYAAIFLRLGSGLHRRPGETPSQRQTYLDRLHPFLFSSTALILAVRISNFGLAVNNGWVFAILSLSAAILLVIKTLRQENQSLHSPFWFMLGAVMITLSTGQDHQSSPLVWGIAILFIGWFSILANPKKRISIIVSILMIAVFFLVNPNMLDFSNPQLGLLTSALPIGAIIIHALLVFTFQKKAASAPDHVSSIAGQSDSAYSVGITILPATFFGLLWLSNIAFPSSPGDLTIWSPVYVFAAALAIYINDRIGIRFPAIIGSLFDRIISPQWILRLSSRMIRALEVITNTITSLLEGEGGVLWALLLVALLVSLITQFPVGN